MFAAAHASRRWLLEGFMYRFHPQMAEAKRRVAAGEIGRVLYIRSHRAAGGRGRDNPRFWRDAGGGALMDIGCYSVNFSRFFAEAEPATRRSPRAFRRANRCGPDVERKSPFWRRCFRPVRVQHGSRTFLRRRDHRDRRPLADPHPWSPPQWPAELHLTRQGKTEIIRIETPDAPPHILAPFALELKHFCRCVRENRAPQFPVGIDAEQDSRGNMRVFEALLKSARATGPAAAPE